MKQILALSTCLLCASVAVAQEPAADSVAVSRVLSAAPATLMLDYFQRLAADLPPEHVVSQTKDAWELRRVELRDQLWQSLGSFPQPPRPPLNARVTGTLDHGDHLVQKLLYESLPGLYVTALVYVPKNIKGRMPAVICVNGHWEEAKATDLIQKRCMGLARMGVIAFCQDVIGTGERQAYQGSPPQTYHGFYRGAAPRIVDRSLLGYVVFECTRALDYLTTRDDVDPQRIMCTGASGGGKQSMFFPALDDRLAGGVPVCYVSSYQAHMGATACVGEVPTNVLRYSNQWEILALHAPRPLLCISASRDVPVFLPKHVTSTLQQTERIYRLYDATEHLRSVEVDSKHDYNLEMRETLYGHVSRYLLNQPRPLIAEPEELPIEAESALRVGLPADSETLQSLTYRRARTLTRSLSAPADAEQWSARSREMLTRLESEIFGGFPASGQGPTKLIRQLSYHGYRVEHWQLVPEPGIVIPAVLCLPPDASADEKRPGVIVLDEAGKQSAFERGLIDQLVAAGRIVLAIDYRGAGETSGSVPSIEYGPGTPEYNLSNYGLFIGRPITGMRVFDVRCATDFLAARDTVDASRISLLGRGRGALVGVLAVALDPRIHSVAAEELLASWVFEEEFADIGLSYLIPRILTVGDMEHLIACIAPRSALVINPVDGRRRSLSRTDVDNHFEFTQSVYTTHEARQQFHRERADPDEVPALLAQWLQSLE